MSDLQLWDGDEADQHGGEGCQTWFTYQAEVVRQFAEEINITQDWIREDYQEMAELLIIYFHGRVRRRNAAGQVYDHAWRMQRPGAVSHARFMAKGIYLMKIYMTRHQVPANVLTPNERRQVERIAKFVFFLYAKYFLQAMIPAAAPRHDLELWENVQQFLVCDPQLVEGVIVSIQRHLWYLSEELVPLSLCDDLTSDLQKAAIVRKMLEAGRPQAFAPQKPVMKSHLLTNKVKGQVQLSHFAGERSWLMFERLDVPVAWMQYSPEDWQDSPDYQRFTEIVDSLEVVNDCAERSIKDVTEFVNYSKDADRRDRVMMVVNHHRQLLDFTNLTKQQMDNMDDFL